MSTSSVGTTDPSTEDDAVLVHRAVADRTAFISLYTRYVVRVERHAAARLGRSDVEDIVSATFMRALEQLHTYRPERGSFAAWLFTIERNLMADQWRAGGRMRALSVDVPDVEGAPNPEVLALRADEATEIRLALGNLTREQRETLALRYAAELSFADVAQVLGKSEAAAKMLVQRGLLSLRRHLEENHDRS